jgi:hypothetical protein
MSRDFVGVAVSDGSPVRVAAPRRKTRGGCQHRYSDLGNQSWCQIPPWLATAAHLALDADGGEINRIKR